MPSRRPRTWSAATAPRPVENDPLGLAADELGVAGLRDLPRELVEPPHSRVGAPHTGRGDEFELSLLVEEVDANELQTVADEKRSGGVRALTESHHPVERRREPREHPLSESPRLRFLVEQCPAERDPDLRGERYEQVSAVVRQPALGRRRHRQRAADGAAGFDGECAVGPPATVLEDLRDSGESLLQLRSIRNDGAAQLDGLRDRRLQGERRLAVQRAGRPLDAEDRPQLEPAVARARRTRCGRRPTCARWRRRPRRRRRRSPSGRAALRSPSARSPAGPRAPPGRRARTARRPRCARPRIARAERRCVHARRSRRRAS